MPHRVDPGNSRQVSARSSRFMAANGTDMSITLAHGTDMLSKIAASTCLHDTNRVSERYDYDLVYRDRYNSRRRQVFE